MTPIPGASGPTPPGLVPVTRGATAASLRPLATSEVSAINVMDVTREALETSKVIVTGQTPASRGEPA
jgi:hypothetical protein